MKQAEVEALYSQKNIHAVLHAAIEWELDKSFINWTLRAYMQIGEYLGKKYFPSKDKRIDELQKYIDTNGLEKTVVAIAASVVHTHTTQTIQQCVGYLQAFLPHEDPFDRARTAGELLAICSKENSFFEIQRNGQGVPATIKVNYWPFIEKKLLNQFDWINDTCFNPPLLEPPQPVTNNRSCGYHSIQEPLLLGRLTDHDEPQNYEAINQLNQIEWILDPGVLKEPERPSKPLMTQQQHSNFMKLSRDSKFIYKLVGLRPFWLAWQYDSRGRIYSHGYHINLQAAEYKKALLNFNQFEELTV